MSMELVRPYSTVERVKNECRLRLDQTDNDEWIKTCINDASRMVERYCRRVFWATEYTDESPLLLPRDAVFADTIFLPLPVIELEKVLVGGAQRESLDTLPQDTGTMIVMATELRENDKVQLVGTFGYTVTEGQQTPPEDLPTEIVRAVTITAAALTGMFQRESISYDGTRNTITDTRIPEDAEKLLKPFKSHVV
jgi:hypothetical protein